MPEIRMDFAAQQQAMSAVQTTTNQITQHLQEMKRLHNGNTAVWLDGAGASYGHMTTTHQTALNSTGEFTTQMHAAMSNSLADYQTAVHSASSGLSSTPVPRSI